MQYLLHDAAKPVYYVKLINLSCCTKSSIGRTLLPYYLLLVLYCCKYNVIIKVFN